jgi:hypothetical protein
VRGHGAVRADAIAAWAVGVGIGLIGLWVAWLVGNRIATLVWGSPLGPAVAFVTAIVVGTAVALLSGARLARSVRRGSVDG